MRTIVLQVKLECTDDADVGVDSQIIQGVQTAIGDAARKGDNSPVWARSLLKCEVTHYVATIEDDDSATEWLRSGQGIPELL